MQAMFLGHMRDARLAGAPNSIVASGRFCINRTKLLFAVVRALSNRGRRNAIQVHTCSHRWRDVVLAEWSSKS